MKLLVAVAVVGVVLGLWTAPIVQAGCNNNFECAAGLFCNTHGPHACAARRTKGETCYNDGWCRPSLRCYQNQCVVPRPAGSPCESKHQCQGTCDDDKCTALRDDGEYCDFPTQCKNGVCYINECNDSYRFQLTQAGRIVTGILVPLLLICCVFIPLAISCSLGGWCQKHSDEGKYWYKRGYQPTKVMPLVQAAKMEEGLQQQQQQPPPQYYYREEEAEAEGPRTFWPPAEEAQAAEREELGPRTFWPSETSRGATGKYGGSVPPSVKMTVYTSSAPDEPQEVLTTTTAEAAAAAAADANSPFPSAY